MLKVTLSAIDVARSVAGRVAPLGLLAALAIVGCGGDDASAPPDAGVMPDAIVGGAQAPFPRLVCPGAAGCEDATGPLRAAFVAVDVTPDLSAKDGGWQDLDGDHVYSSGEPFDDRDDDGDFDAVWIGGAQNARPAVGVHDPIWARVAVFERGELRVGLVVYDFIGWFINEMDATRARLEASLGLDHVVFASTHSHQSPDTMGLWGETSLVTGVDLDYHAWVHARTAEALAEAVAALEPVTMSVAAVPTLDDAGSAQAYVADVRDPIILDPTLTIAQFRAVAEPGRTVGTVVHWAAHPEYVGFDNNLLSSDVVHYIRETIEDGAAANAALPAVEGVGGVALYVQGALGGQVGPIGTRPPGPDGEPVTEEGFARAEAAGVAVGRLALEALATPAQVEDVADPRLTVRTGELALRVENTFYHVGGVVGVFHRDFLGWDTARPIDDDNMPYVASRVTYLELGPIGAITAPGELHPELFVGGYDGSWSWGVPIVAADNENPPDLSLAPAGPYLRELLLANDGVRYPLVLGLAEDTVGYIVPAWNYELSEDSPYLEEAPGDHYEETNSVGPTCEAEIVGPMRDLVTWRP